MKPEDERAAAYHRRYDRLKQLGKPFFPDVIFKDTVMVLIVFLIAVTLAAFVGVPLEREADPTSTSYVPRPEWYFLFLFQMLKYFPGNLEFVGILVIPTVAIVMLFLVPFVDRNPARRYRRRPLALALGAAAMAAIAFLSVVGAVSQPPAVTTAASSLDFGKKLSPFEREGRRVYQANSCFVCHQINGSGGAIGPDLSTVGTRLDASWLVRHLESPRSIAPGTSMPEFNLSNQDLMALTAYLLTLRERQAPIGPVEGALSPAAIAGKETFSTLCNACHPGGGAGIGPKVYGADFAKRYADDAALVQIIRSGKGSMPGFGSSQLSDSQMADLITYLRSLKDAGQ